MTDEVVVYGFSWDGFTQHTLRQLNELDVAYSYVDVDENPDAKTRIAELNNGRLVCPMLDLNGDIFFNLDPVTLQTELTKRGLLG